MSVIKISSLAQAVTRLGAALLATGLTLFGGQAPAGMLGMPRALPDFHFNGNRLVYDLSLRGSRLTLTADNTVRLTASDSPADPLTRPALRLRAGRRGGDLLDGQFNLFGALTPAAEEDVPALLTASVDAMKTAGSTDQLEFMLVGGSTTGTRAQQFRNLGVFTSVAGIPDEEFWAQAETMGTVLSLMESSELLNPLTPTNGNPAPVPGPVWLLAIGLLPLIGLRRVQVGRESASQSQSG